ncbi:hypothetical protein TCAL_12088 [Tigriopus californicus]|uniref:Timeless N-terminal domain-containing protein n=3 Tax=Tigriopus californicus TaxID=6832 RepID=A0A553NR27_TIGCA|nr:hypothetical protein TCAL_12088 [Tigriopus californicus]
MGGPQTNAHSDPPTTSITISENTEEHLRTSYAQPKDPGGRICHRPVTPTTSEEDSPTGPRCHIPDPPGSTQSLTETTNSEVTPPRDCDPAEESVEHNDTDTKETSLIVEGSDDYDEDDDEEEDELRNQIEHSQEIQDDEEDESDHLVKEDDSNLDPETEADQSCNSGSHNHSKSPLLSEEDLYIEEGVRSLLCEVIFEESGEELRLEEEEELKEEEERRQDHEEEDEEEEEVEEEDEEEEEDDEEDEDDMDWMYFNPDAATFNSLGCYVGEKYKVAANARDTLVLMTKKLKEEDPILRTFRRALGHNQVIQKDLAPILVETTNDRNTFGAAIRFLNNYLTPVECLLSLDDLSKTEEGQQTVFELNQHLSEAKNVFLDHQITKNVLDFMTKELQKIQELTVKSASEEDIAIASQRSINDCLILLRNVLHIPDDTPSGSSSPSSTSSNQKTTRQSQILWNLFSANLDAVVMKIIGHKKLKNWCTILTQVIALIYKDQHVYNLQRLLGQWLETEISESSEDNESNTSPQDQNGSCSSPVLTSAETDDSSDGALNGRHGNSDKEGSCQADASSCTDSGHETKVDDRSNSTKSPPGSTKYSDEDTTSARPAGNKTSCPKSGGSGTINKNKNKASPSGSSGNQQRQKQEPMECSSSEGGSSGKEPPYKRIAVEQGKSGNSFSHSPHQKNGKNSGNPAKGDQGQSNVKSHGGNNSTELTTPVSGNGNCCSTQQNHKRKASSVLTSSDDGSVCSNRKDRDKMFKNSTNVQQSKKKSQKISTETTNVESKPEMVDSGKNSSSTSSTGSKNNDNGEKDQSSSSAESNSDKARPCSMRSEGMSDYGYVSQRNMETQENGSSTSSNDDDNERKRKVKPHTNLQKPRPQKPNISPAEKRELRRQKLINRAKTERMKVKSLVHHIPTEDDVADLLKEFTVDFLLKGYSTLVDELRKQLLNDFNAQMDKSHFLWLVTYFLKFASQLEVGFELIGPVLSVPTISYLTYEGVRFYEELELACRMKTIDLRPHLRRMHLVITAIHEFIQTLENYSNFKHFSQQDQESCIKIQLCCLRVTELRQLFVLLIRRFNPNVQSLQYLHDLVSANHSLLVMMEKVNLDEDFMTNHLQQFASVEVMRQYGLLLENFYTNTDVINDAIFTMMHHISGDLNAPEALYVPQILKSFSDIWEQETDICEDWSDLIEYVIQKFITTMGTKPHACASNLLDSLDPNSDALDENGFSKNQLDNLYWYFSQCENTEDPVGGIIEMYKASYSVTKTRVSVIHALLSQGIITHAQYMGLMYMKSILSCKPYHEGSVVAEAGSEHSDSERHDIDIGEHSDHDNKGHGNDQVDVLKELLKKQGKGYLLQWLQGLLIDVCRVKLNSSTQTNPYEEEVLEPIPFHFNNVNQSIPVVPWNKQQESGLQTETFILLLHKLGFHLAADVGKSFPRIPHFWPAEHILNLASKLGHLRIEDMSTEMSALLALTSEAEKEDLAECASPLAVTSYNSPITRMDTSDTNASSPRAVSTGHPSPFSPEIPRKSNSVKCEAIAEENPEESESPPLTLFSPVTTTKDSLDTFSMPTPTYSWLQMAMLSKNLQKASLALNASTVASSTQASSTSGHEFKSLPTAPLRPLSASSASKPITVTTRSTFVVPSTGFNEGSSRTWSGNSPSRPRSAEVPTILSEAGNRGSATPDPSVMMTLMNQSINNTLNRMQMPEGEDYGGVPSDDALMKSSSSRDNLQWNASES